MRKLETNIAYGLEVLLINKENILGKQQTLKSLAKQIGLMPNILFALEDKKFVQIDSIKISIKYIEAIKQAEREYLTITARKNVAPTSLNHFQSHKKEIKQVNIDGTFLGKELKEKIVGQGSVLVDLDKLKYLHLHAYVIDDLATFIIDINETKAQEWLKKYITDFTANEVDPGFLESLSYEKLRQDFINHFQQKLATGISPTGVQIWATNVYKNDELLHKAKLVETLIALETEGAIKILELSNEDYKNYDRVVKSSNDFRRYPTWARVSIINLAVPPLTKSRSINTSVLIDEMGTINYNGRKIKTTKTAKEILKRFRNKSVGEELSWDELYCDIEYVGSIKDRLKARQKIYDSIRHINEKTQREFNFCIFQWKEKSVSRLE